MASARLGAVTLTGALLALRRASVTAATLRRVARAAGMLSRTLFAAAFTTTASRGTRRALPLTTVAVAVAVAVTAPLAVTTLVAALDGTALARTLRRRRRGF